MTVILLNVCLSLAGNGMDCSITRLRHGGLCLVQTTDFFYPNVDDPYMQVSVYLYLNVPVPKSLEN